MLTETLADAEVDIKSLKNIVERKDDELSQSEEQCRHLVRLSEQRHQQILYITTAMNTLEKKAKDIILKQVSKIFPVHSSNTVNPCKKPAGINIFHAEY